MTVFLTVSAATVGNRIPSNATDCAQRKKASPKDKPYKLADEKGLYLVIDLLPVFWTAASWKIPVMLRGPERGERQEGIEVFGDADCLCAAPG